MGMKPRTALRKLTIRIHKRNMRQALGSAEEMPSDRNYGSIIRIHSSLI